MGKYDRLTAWLREQTDDVVLSQAPQLLKDLTPELIALEAHDENLHWPQAHSRLLL